MQHIIYCIIYVKVVVMCSVPTDRREGGGAMDKVRKILVYVCKDRAAPQRAQFVQVGADAVSDPQPPPKEQRGLGSCFFFMCFRV